MNLTPASLIVVLLSLAGCTSPPTVQTLSERTAANVGVISGQLDRMSASSRELGELRAARVARLQGVNADLRAEYLYDLALTEKGGGGDDIKLIKEIEAWGDEVEKIYAASAGVEAKRKQEILEGQTKLDSKSKALSGIAKSLASLAAADNLESRLKFLAGYALELKSEVDERLEQNDESAKAAKKLMAGLGD